MSGLDRPIFYTLFRTSGAWEKDEVIGTLRDFGPVVKRVTKSEKKWLPWVKLARFGDDRLPNDKNPPEKWSFRHDANVLAISGIEADYDHGVIHINEAVEIVRRAQIAAMIYTSPSHTDDMPKWRILCPLSRDYPPSARAGFLRRLNGLFMGAISRESFTLSQSYYYGCVKRNPSHCVEFTEGVCIDLRDDLDQGAIGPPKIEYTPTQTKVERSEDSSRFVEAIIKNALSKLAGATDGQKHLLLRAQATLLGGYHHAASFTIPEMAEQMVNALPDSVRDRKAAINTAISGLEYGAGRPIEVKPFVPRYTNGHAPPAEDDTAGMEPDPYPDPYPDDIEAEEHVNGNVVQLPKPKKKRRDPDDWRGQWHRSDTGSPLPTLFNVMLTLRCHDPLLAIVSYDEMNRAPVLTAQIPNSRVDAKIPRQIKDSDVIAIQEAIQDIGLRRIPKMAVQDGIKLRAAERSFHPVKDYLDDLQWDGETRIGGWLGKYLGVTGGEYSDKIGRLFLIALVARIYKPGCKSDYMLILEGPQGQLKSTACAALAGEWFSDKLPNITHGDAVRLSMHLRGKWLIEIPELAAFASTSGTESLKAFLTQTDERYTPKYGENEVFEPRQCLFIGSTNEKVYLRDATGNRRFWPVLVGEIDIDALRADRDQLLAEAVAQFKSGAQWWPDREFEAKHILPEQAARYEEDPWEAEIRAYVKRDGVYHCTTNEVLRHGLSMTAEKFGTREIRRVSAILTRMGWERNLGKNGRPYERPEGWRDDHIVENT